VPPTENGGPPSKPDGQEPLDVLAIWPEYVPRPIQLALNVPWTAKDETGSTPQLWTAGDHWEAPCNVPPIAWLLEVADSKKGAAGAVAGTSETTTATVASATSLKLPARIPDTVSGFDRTVSM